MQTPAPKAWFLGPKAENQEFFERMLLESFRDYCYWRRHFHPEDQANVKASDRMQPEFLAYQENLHDHLSEMLAHLKQSMPFFSPRYLGHMAKDLLIPGLLGYISAMFYNQNNITREAATVTMRFEVEAMKMIVAMLGYEPQQAWGHLCSGGTAANVEALWVARNLRLFPWQLALSRHHSQHAPLNRLLDSWLAEVPGPSLFSSQRLFEIDATLRQHCHQDRVSAELLNACSVMELGLLGFFQACQTYLPGAPARLRIAYSQNAHYSLRKSLNLLGLGENSALKIPLDAHFRMDTQALRQTLLDLPAEQMVLAVIGVYGSTEEGALDDFDSLLNVRQEYEAEKQQSFWLHADACYGGYALSMLEAGPALPEQALELQHFLQTVMPQQPPDRVWTQPHCERWLRVSAALGQCDSISLDPHKLGYLPYPAGSVLYQDYRSREFIRCEAPYLNAVPEGETDYWQTAHPGRYTLEGSRPGATSAAIWLAHRTIPLNRQGHGRLVAGSLLGARYLQQVLTEVIARELPGIQCCFLCAEPDLNVLCYTFRGHWQGRPLLLEQANQLVNELYERLLARTRLQTLDFILSMTRIHANSYGHQAPSYYWQALQPELPADAPATATELTLLRTVVMDPFLPEAMTRQEADGQYMPLAQLFAQTLAQEVSAWLATDSLR